MLLSSGNLTNTTDAINKSGSFLQTFVMHKLDDAAWRVDSEFPVQAAPFIDDPIKNPIHRITNVGGRTEIIYHPANLIKSMIESQNKIELEETIIDVVGGTGGAGNRPTFFLCIECKKLDPDYVDWVFFNTSDLTANMHLVTKNIRSEGFVSLFKIPGTSQHGNEIHVDLSKFETWAAFQHTLSNNSIALSNERIDRNTWKTKKSLVDDACRQIIKGTYGLILNNLQHQILSGEGYENRTVVYVPIVVTTANLKICKVDPNDIDPATGYTTREPTYDPTDSIIFECPPPKSVRFPHPDFNSLSVEHRRAVLKWHVLIFSPRGFVNFLQKLHDTGLVW